MSIEVACTCGKRFRAADEFLGRPTTCPSCGNPLVVGQQQPIAAPQANPWQPMGQAPGAVPQGVVLAGGLPPSLPPHPGFGQAVPPGYGAGSPGYGALGYDPQGYGAPTTSIGGVPMSVPQFRVHASAPAQRKSAAPLLLIVGGIALASLLLVCGVGWIVWNVVGQARAAARRAGGGNAASLSFLPSTSADERKRHDALIEQFLAQLNEYADLLSRIHDATSAQPLTARAEQLANEIQSTQLRAQMELLRLPADEDQRLEQKYGARLQAAIERAQREDNRVLQLAMSWPLRGFSAGLDFSAGGLGGAVPPGITDPTGMGGAMPPGAAGGFAPPTLPPIGGGLVPPAGGGITPPGLGGNGPGGTFPPGAGSLPPGGGIRPPGIGGRRGR